MSLLPLWVHSHYSLGWGTASPQALCQAARRLGYPALALTDRDNLYGLWEFLKHCRLEGVRPVVGAEVNDPGGEGRAVCLVKDQTGFANLCRLLTARHRQADFRLAAALPPLGQGLAVLTDHAGLLEAWHGPVADLGAALPRGVTGQTYQLRKLARRLEVPLVAAPDSYFLAPEEHHFHQVLRAISLNTCLSRLGRDDMAPAAAWLAPPAEYARRYQAQPQALANAAHLGERLRFVPQPRTVMPPWRDARGRPASLVLRGEAYRGAQGRYGRPLPPAVVERLERELAVIAAKDFSSYFLVVRDIVRRSPRICGRGSGAASLVAYCLGITNVCPLKYNLYFERFINPQREDPPDIDVDFAWDERDDVINSVLAQYEGRAAMVGTHIAFQGKMAIREVAKVYGLPAQEVKHFMRGLPWLRGPAESETGFYPRRQALPPGARADYPAPWPEVLRLAQRLVGTPRHLSVHVGGVVITPGPMDQYAPMETAAKGVPVVQWEKDGTELAGLVKIDLLGNRSLAVIRDAITNLRGNGGTLDDTAWQPEDDPATQALVATGRTMGCFYIESPATRLLQEKAAVGDYEHLVIHSSIIRPAANVYIQEYLRRLRGGAWEPLHPLLAGILDETYGIMVYQEQVSQAAVALAGFSHAQGDGLRKVLGKKDKERALADFRHAFTAGALARGVGQAVVEEIWRMMLSFEGYSFCKPHSASYARVSFQAAYLKAHHPAEFMAAVISNQGGFYSTFAYVSEARRLGLEVLPPDVSQSQVHWASEAGRLRVGLMAVKDLGLDTRQRILGQRPFRDFIDFLRRARPEEPEAKALIQAGACDAIAAGQSHEQMLWQTTCRARQGQAAPDLFTAPAPTPPPLPPAPEIQRLRRQYRVLGFLTDRHPMVLFAERLRETRRIPARDLAAHVGRRVCLAGWLITGKTVATSRDEPMQFLTFEDETGLVEATFFPDVYRRFYLILDWERPYLLRGLVEENYGAATLTVEHVQPVPVAHQ